MEWKAHSLEQKTALVENSKCSIEAFEKDYFQNSFFVCLFQKIPATPYLAEQASSFNSVRNPLEEGQKNGLVNK